MRALLLAMLLLVLPVTTRAGSTPDEVATSHAVSQARHFIRKGWYADARAELLSVAENSVGGSSYEVHWLLAQVCYELQDVGEALRHAELAILFSPTTDSAVECHHLVQDLEASFGSLEISAPHAGMESRLQLELASSLFDPGLKRFVNRVTLSLKERTALPVVVWLPAGNYLVNGQAVTVLPGQPASLKLPMNALGSRGLAALQVLRVELSAGFGVFLGERLSNLHPGIETQLGITQPLGRVLLGLTFDKAFRSYDVEQHEPAGSPLAMAAGLRLGTELFVGGPLALRPSLGYRYGLLPGLAFACQEADAGLACAPELEGAEPASRFYAVAPFHAAYGELSADYRQGGRANALGIGVRFALEGVFGSAPSSSEGHLYDESKNQVQAIRITDGAFQAFGIRLLANLSLAI